jgi:hypothetical protein
LVGDFAEVEVLLRTWVLVVVASIVLHKLGVEATVEMTGGDAAGRMFATGCSRQRGGCGTGQQRAVVVVCGGGSPEVVVRSIPIVEMR